MAILKLSDDFYEPACSLIAVHCSMEAYRMAYFLNLHLQTRLKRITIKKPDSDDELPECYQWENRMEDVVWSLMVNVKKTLVSSSEGNLFPSGVLTITRYLIPELKKVDYFLKIDNEERDFTRGKQIVQKINKIPQVTTAYEVDANQLKSKHNLIF